MIAPDDDLLMPRFYVAEGLEGWLREMVKRVERQPASLDDVRPGADH